MGFSGDLRTQVATFEAQLELGRFLSVADSLMEALVSKDRSESLPAMSSL